MEYKGLSSGICRLSATHRKQGAHWVFGWVPEMNHQAALKAILCLSVLEGKINKTIQQQPQTETPVKDVSITIW